MEIGDTLFTLICLSNTLGINLDEALNKTLRKYKERDNGRWKKIKDHWIKKMSNKFINSGKNLKILLKLIYYPVF